MSWPWRGSIGIIVNHCDPVPEAEFNSMAPAGVSIHAARFVGPRRKNQDYGDDAAREFIESSDVQRGLQALGGMRLDAIALCFATASLLGPRDFDDQLIARAQDPCGDIPVTTTTRAIAAGLEALEADRLMLVYPPWFSDPLMEAGIAYWEARGYRVARSYRVSVAPGSELLEPYELYDRGAQWVCSPELAYQEIRRNASGKEAIVALGNGMFVADAIAALERDVGQPVLAPNQACMWHALRLGGLGADVVGYGRLFETRSEAGRDNGSG